MKKTPTTHTRTSVSTRKLALGKEIVRVLGEQELTLVDGGAGLVADSRRIC